MKKVTITGFDDGNKHTAEVGFTFWGGDNMKVVIEDPESEPTLLQKIIFFTAVVVVFGLLFQPFSLLFAAIKTFL